MRGSVGLVMRRFFNRLVSWRFWPFIGFLLQFFFPKLGEKTVAWLWLTVLYFNAQLTAVPSPPAGIVYDQLAVIPNPQIQVSDDPVGVLASYTIDGQSLTNSMIVNSPSAAFVIPEWTAGRPLHLSPTCGSWLTVNCRSL